MSDSLARFRWLDAAEHRCPLGGIFTVSFFHGLGTGEVLRRFGADPAAAQWVDFGQLHDRVEHFVSKSAGGDNGGCVGVVDTGEWSTAIEPWGWQATLHDVVDGLSRDCEVVAVTRHDYAEHTFVHAVGGSIATGFDPHFPSRRYGRSPNALAPLMRRLGVDPDEEEMFADDPLAMSFALAAGISGVEFTPSMLERPLLVRQLGGAREAG